MGNYISIGIVCLTQTSLELVLETISAQMNNKAISLELSYPEDDSSRIWIKQHYELKSGLSAGFKLLADRRQSIGTFLYNADTMQLHIRVSIKTDAILGILFEMEQEELIPVESSFLLESITNKIIKDLKALWERAPFEYAFCDNEADIEFAPSEILKTEEYIYSVLLINRNHFLTHKMATWCIDGLSERTQII